MKSTHRTYRTLTGLALVAILALAAGTALAQGPGKGRRCGDEGPRGRGAGGRIERMAEQLDLTDDQRAEIAGIREEGREQRLELRKRMMRLRNELHGEMLQDEPSRKKVLELNGKIGALRTEMQAQRLEHRLAIREKLTPEQRDRMLLATGRGHGGHGGRHGRDFGRGGFKGARGGRPGANPDCPLKDD